MYRSSGLHNKFYPFILTFVATLFAFGTMQHGLLIQPALADDPDPAHSGAGCTSDGDRGYVTAVEDQSASDADLSQATSSHIVIPDNSAFCQRVSSIYVQKGFGGFEAGMLVGYSNCPGYQGIWYAHPRPFIWVKLRDGTFAFCKVFTGASLNEGGTDTFSAQNIDGDNRWNFWLNGVLMGGTSIDFLRGYDTLGTERGHGYDVCFARFNQLSEYHSNGGDWSYWDDLGSVGDRDPDCHFNRIDDASGQVLDPN